MRKFRLQNELYKSIFCLLVIWMIMIVLPTGTWAGVEPPALPPTQPPALPPMPPTLPPMPPTLPPMPPALPPMPPALPPMPPALPPMPPVLPPLLSVLTPPVGTPPVLTPPVLTPPVLTPPVGTPPVGTPPVGTPPVATPPVLEKPIIADRLTVVELQDVIRIVVAAGAIVGDTPTITAQVMPEVEAASLLAEATVVGLTAASDVVMISLTGGQFAAQVQVTLIFDTAKVAKGLIPRVFVYNDRTERWIYLGGQVGDGMITISVNTFSKFAVFAAPPLPPLTDIANHWGKVSIKTLAGMGIVSGFPDGNFNPGAKVTRAEFVSMLTRALNLQSNPEAAARFTDAVGWAQGAIGAATKAGLIAGYADNTFGGDRQITRAEMAVIIKRVISKRLVPVAKTAEVDFVDANDFPHWAVDGIRMASRSGLLRGFQDRTFRSGNVATRAEAAAMLYRLVAER